MYKKKELWRLATFSIGAPLGNLEECSLTRDFERKYKMLSKWNMSLYWSSVRGTWRYGFFTGKSES